MRKAIVSLALVASVAAVAGAFGAGSALAYGRADQPVAQVEMSGNCNNVAYCNAVGFGTGGIWIWAELDGGPSSGTTDFTFAGCGHTVGGGGPGSAGAGGGPGTGTWKLVPSVFAVVADGAFPLDVAMLNGAPNPSVPYYEIDLGGGFVVAAPAAVGHYSTAGIQFGFPSLGPPPAGVNFQTQVAP
jgi:hypothetical protein